MCLRGVEMLRCWFSYVNLMFEFFVNLLVIQGLASELPPIDR